MDEERAQRFRLLCLFLAEFVYLCNKEKLGCKNLLAANLKSIARK